MSEGRYKYPFCECAEHKGPQRSYCVCLHVRDGAPVFHVELATDHSSGVIVCERDHPDDPDALCLVCESCVIENGWLITDK